jgi:tetratricopeptide (TPR) repeat protein
MARSLIGDHRPKEALDLLEPAVSRFPDGASLREDLAGVLLESGRPQEAERHLRVVVEREPRQVAPRLKLAATLVRLGRLREAAAAFLKVVESSPRSEEGRKALAALVPLADQLLDRGELMEAHQAYRAALGQEGIGEEEVYLNLALVAYRLGRRGESLEVLQQGLARHPGSAELHYRVGRLHAEGGRPAAAEHEYRRTLELDAGRKDARAALASLIRSSGARP